MSLSPADFPKPCFKVARFANRVRPLSLIFNGLFAIIFALLHVWPLVFVYLAGLIFQIWLEMLNTRKAEPMLHWNWLLGLLQITVTAVLIGPKADFQQYLFAALLMIFFSLKQALLYKVLRATLVIGIFLTIDIWLEPGWAVFPQSSAVLTTLSHVNTLGSSLVLAGMAHAQALTRDEAEENLRQAATTDELTGLFNRRAIGSFIDQEAARSARTGHPLSFVLCDIDRFKQINDTWGHAAGDHVLKRLSVTLKTILRGYDGIARWGGEEFLIVLPDASPESAVATAERIRKLLAGVHIEFQDERIQISMTFGVSGLMAEENWQAAIARADDALYRGKTTGRNRVELA